MKTLVKFIAIFAFLLPNYINSDISPTQQEMLDTLPPDQRESIMQKMLTADKLETEIAETFEEESSLTLKPEIIDEKELEGFCEDCIYGFNLFKYSPSTFAPSNQVPINANYSLGPGDKLEIIFYGNDQKKIEKFISRDGSIILPELGPVYLAGLTFSQAVNELRSKVEEKMLGTEVSLRLTELRSITVYILGQAYKPGSYTLSSLSTVTNALFQSGGVAEDGSLRNILVRRKGEEPKKYDFYEILLSGQTENDFRLQDGDTIFIPFIENKFKSQGAFKRESFFEFLPGETVKDAIDLAGGYRSEVLSKPRIELSRVNLARGNREISYLESDQLDEPLVNGDAIGVSSISGVDYQSITLTGEFTYPGVYSIKPGDTLSDVLERAGGLTSDAFPIGTVFTREEVALQQTEAFRRNADDLENTIVNIITLGNISVDEFTFTPLSKLIARLRSAEPIGRQVIEFSPLKLKTNPAFNFKVVDGDKLHVPKRPESVSVAGEVLNSATHRFNPNFSVEDYLELSGGLTNEADKSRILVIKPNGQSVLHKKRLFFKNTNAILPGTTIVVSRDTRPFDAIQLTQIVTPILADLATSAAAIAAISND
tara:strand:+ start:1965 stop:3758 length:1794 start_codon:yes stop_codon:yes gene_type:complete